MSTERPDEAVPAAGLPEHRAKAADAGAADDAQAHDPAGLDLARAVASGARATPRQGGTVSNRQARSPEDSALSGAHPDPRDPAPISSVVERLVEQGGWETDLKVHGVFGRWSRIVGDEVAAHCTPARFDDGRLEVRTDSTAWATQLRLLAPELVRRLNEELGHGTVLRIDVKGPDAPSWRRGPRSVRGARGPRDTYG